MTGSHPVQLDVEYPDRQLNRLTTAFRIFTVIPIAIVLGAVSGGAWSFTIGNGATETTTTIVAGAGGILFAGPLLMIVFRQKYPRWWFDWNLELTRFSSRVALYGALLDDRYPSTDERQSLVLNVPYPDANTDLNRWLPLVKWFLGIPHARPQRGHAPPGQRARLAGLLPCKSSKPSVGLEPTTPSLPWVSSGPSMSAES